MPRIWEFWRERRANRSNRDRQNALKSDYRATFGTEAGQRVLADMLIRWGVMQDPWNGDGAEAVAYRAGKRRAGLEIIEMINADPNAAERLARTGMTEELYENDPDD